MLVECQQLGSTCAPFTRARVPNRATLLDMRPKGKTENFSAAQMVALRDTLRGITGPKETQAELAHRLGVSQQSISRAQDPRRGGMLYPLASAIARAAGFSGVDELFEFHGVTGHSHPTIEHQNLAMARRIAINVYRCPEWVITAVVEHAGGPTTVLGQAVWLDRFRASQLAAEVAQRTPDPPPAPKSSPGHAVRVALRKPA